LTTEENYVTDLETCIEVYLKPLRENGLIKSNALIQIFGNWELIFSLHKDLVKKLNVATEAENTSLELSEDAFIDDIAVRIGNVFADNAEQMVSIYTTYCSDHYNALKIYSNAVNASPKLKKFIDDIVQDGSQTNLYLHDFLIKPIQRICKYPLLFRELLKKTSDDSKGHRGIKVVYDTLNVVAVFVNKNKEAYENDIKLKEIDRLLEDYPGKSVILPGRSFLKEGPLRKFNKKMKPQMRHFFCFNDIMIYAKDRGESHKVKRFIFKGEIPLKCCVVGDISSQEKASRQKTMQFGFQITRLDEKRVYHVSATNEAEKTEWVNTLNKIIMTYLEMKRRDQKFEDKFGKPEEKKVEPEPEPLPDTDKKGTLIQKKKARKNPSSDSLKATGGSLTKIKSQQEELTKLLKLETEVREQVEKKLRTVSQNLDQQTELNKTLQLQLESLQKELLTERENRESMEKKLDMMINEFEEGKKTLKTILQKCEERLSKVESGARTPKSKRKNSKHEDTNAIFKDYEQRMEAERKAEKDAEKEMKKKGTKISKKK